MRFTVRHLTRYSYSEPIRLGPHLLRLTPRGGAASGGGTLIARDLTVTPAPVVREDVTGADGSPFTRLEFSGETRVFAIESRFTFDTAAPEPLSMPLPGLPWAAPGLPEAMGLSAAGQGAAREAIDPEVVRFADALMRRAGGLPATFLAALTAELFTRTDRHIRPSGYAQSAAETLITARGACRDIAVLFIAAVRSQGMPARFVSGYQARAESVDGKRHLHAWPEVYIPGTGWRGFDPTHGLPVTDGHVALCAAADQLGTMPIEGGFWGGNVTSTLDYAVEIAVGG